MLQSVDFRVEKAMKEVVDELCKTGDSVEINELLKAIGLKEK